MNEDLTTNTQGQTIEKKNSFREEVWETVRFVAIALIIVAPIRLFIALPFIVSGASMDPTFATNQYLIVDEISYRFSDPARGDVVVFKYPKNPKQFFIKRIIGLPGETVSVDAAGQVTIKDSSKKTKLVISEPYVKFTKSDNIEMTLDNNEYFVMGDNRAGSYDSRAWGPVSRDLIIGKTFVRLFPLSAIDLFPGQFRQ